MWDRMERMGNKVKILWDMESMLLDNLSKILNKSIKTKIIIRMKMGEIKYRSWYLELANICINIKLK